MKGSRSGGGGSIILHTILHTMGGFYKGLRGGESGFECGVWGGGKGRGFVMKANCLGAEFSVSEVRTRF